MKRINYDILCVGDIVLTTSPAVKSKVIRGVTKSDISHAMICVSKTSLMDSTGEGVQARNPQKIFYPDDCAIHIRRLKEGLDSEVARSIISYVRQVTGTPYATAEVLRSVASPLSFGSSKQFCSRLVARAFSSAGISLCDNPDFCTPEDLKESQLLEEIIPAWIEVSNDEVAAIERSDATVGMRKVTSDLLAAARAIFPKIESLSDITRTAIERPDLDDALADALVDSGYLDYWRTQEHLFPWRYDFNAMISFAFESKQYDAISDYCRMTLQGEIAGEMDHWKKCLESYEQLCAVHQRRVLDLERGLYRNLVVQHGNRVEAAECWLRLGVTT
ncbi:MAG: hypothetical protein J0M09_17570 [Xanthomonadales bacterium]|nr:hypothetical protein [Xanthomonadales bacterium]